MSMPSIKRYVKSDYVQPNKQEEVTSAIVKYLIKSMRPIAEIENEGFIDLLSTIAPTYHPPSRKLLRSKIMNSCGSVVKCMQTEIGAAMFRSS